MVTRDKKIKNKGRFTIPSEIPKSFAKHLRTVFGIGRQEQQHLENKKRRVELSLLALRFYLPVFIIMLIHSFIYVSKLFPFQIKRRRRQDEKH